MRSDQPTDVRKGENLDLAKLNEFTQQAAPSIGKVLSHQQFPGGYSNLTYLLITDCGEFVLRRPPVGAAIKSAHDMGREFKVLSLLKSHYKRVPEPIVFCEDIAVIGAPFYIMERLKGIILRPSTIKKNALSQLEMKSLSESLVDNLVDLHALDIQKTGLDQLGKPEGYISRQVDGWTKRYIASQTEVIDAMDSLSRWLSSSQPPEGSPTLLHNDYKFDNVVFAQGRLPEIVGVLDWEMATVGDPWMDVGAALAYWAEAADGEMARVFNISWLPGNLSRREFVERYVQKSGRKADNPVFYYAFGLFKNAVIAQQIYARWKQGHSKDPRFGELIHVIRDLGNRGVRAVDQNHL